MPYLRGDLRPARGQRLVVRNAGGLAGRQAGPVEYATGENAAYATVDAENTARLKSAGVTTARP